MMITMPMARESGPGGRSRRWWLRWPALVAAGFVASWIAGLSVWLSNLAVDAGAGLVNATFAAHHTVAAVQFVLTEGLPAIALALIPAALGLRARHAGQTAAG
jgi:hypothetical protein